MNKNKLEIIIHKLPDGKFGIRYNWGFLHLWECKRILTKDELLSYINDEIKLTFTEVTR